MGKSLEIEDKIDYSSESNGFLYAVEFMKITNNIDKLLDIIDDDDEVDIEDRLRVALSIITHNTGFKNVGTNNDIAIKSNSLPILKYRDNDIISFTITDSNTDVCSLALDDLTPKTLLMSDGLAIPNGYLKSNHIISVMYDETDDVFKVLNSNADAEMVEELMLSLIDSIHVRIVSNKMEMIGLILEAKRQDLLTRELLVKTIERVKVLEDEVEELKNN